MKKLLILCFVFLLFCSCDMQIKNVSPDYRFMGEWVSTEAGEYLKSIQEFTFYSYISKKFNDTNQYCEYRNFHNYGIQKYGYPSMYLYEWKIENGKFAEKLWDNDYSDWKYYDFEFIDSNHFILTHTVDREYAKIKDGEKG